MNIQQLYQPTVLLSLILMTIIIMMVLPVPAWVLDFGLTASFTLAILIFTVTIFIERPLEFSVFPTILLAGLLLRLSLNISSTKLIIGEGHTGTDAAGGVIQGFAMFIMGGNVLIGIVIFCVLLIVNFMVITKGAGRMAEVGARFALDAMPGKQLAIDADVAAGSLTHEEAKERREREQEETTFFGSLDGASKFVKGDAIAGLLITLLNIIVGLALGISVHGLSFEQAINTYAALTIGDGLVSQIPAVITSIGAALLLSKGGGKGSIDSSLFSQLGAHPMALGTVSALLAIFAVVPGLPFIPFMFAASILGFIAWKKHQSTQLIPEIEDITDDTENQPTEPALGDLLDLDEIHIEFARNIVSIALATPNGFESRIINIRKYIAKNYGFILPSVRLTDNAELKDGIYRIKIQGVDVAESYIDPSGVLVLLREDINLPVQGKDVLEPVYGAPARWIANHDSSVAEGLSLTVIDPIEAATTHLLEVLKDNFGTLLTRRTMRQVLDEFLAPSDQTRATSNKRILDEYVPDKVPLDLLQSILRLMLQERLSIRNLPVILEAVSEGKNTHPTADQLYEYVRQRLSFQLTAGLRNEEGIVPLLQLSTEWEEIFNAHEYNAANGVFDVALPPDEFNRLANNIQEKINTASEDGTYPAIITHSKRRRFIRTVMEAKNIQNPVLSFEEFGTKLKPALVGVI